MVLSCSRFLVSASLDGSDHLARSTHTLEQRLVLLNCFAAILYGTANLVTAFRPVTDMEAVHTHRSDDTVLTANESLTRALLADSGWEMGGGSAGNYPYVDLTWVPSRKVVTTDAVHEAMRRLGDVLPLGIQELEYYALLHRAVCAANNKGYVESLVLSWSVIEVVSRRVWQSFASSLAANPPAPKSVSDDRLDIRTVISLLSHPWAPGGAHPAG